MSRESKQPTAVQRVVAGPERFTRRESHETRTRFRSESTLAELLWTLFQGRRTLLAITALSLAFAATYVWIVTPQYASNVVVQVDPKTKVLAGLEDISAAFSEGTPADTEIQIIRSRTLLRSAAEQLQLDVQTRPRRFPIIGKAIARNYKGSGPAAAPFNLGRFNWGGESIRVTRLSVPNRLLGEPLTLTVIDEGRYKVETKDGEPLLAGEVDKLATGEVDKLPLEIFIQEMRARPGAQFILQKLRLDDVVHGLGSNLKVAEPTRRTGVITLSLMGSDPVLVADTLNAIATSYQRQNVAFRSADAAKTLEFLETQLPTLKQNLDKAEAALNAFRLSRGTVDLSRETQSILERTVEIEKALSDLDMQRTELRQRFTGGHPALSSADEKSASLRHQQSALQTRMRNLPVTELDSARLVRDAKVANELYFLVSKPGLAKYSATEFTSYAIWAGTVPMLLFARSLFAQMQQAPPSATAAGIYLGIFPGAIAYVLWGYGLSKMPASRVSAFLYLQPANAAIIAWFWLGEIPGAAELVGGMIAIAGVVLINTLGQVRVSAEAIELGEESAHG